MAGSRSWAWWGKGSHIVNVNVHRPIVPEPCTTRNLTWPGAGARDDRRPARWKPEIHSLLPHTTITVLKLFRGHRIGGGEHRGTHGSGRHLLEMNARAHYGEVGWCSERTLRTSALFTPLTNASTLPTSSSTLHDAHLRRCGIVQHAVRGLLLPQPSVRRA